MSQEQTVDRSRGCLLGLAVGDAVGTTVEFEPRGTFPPMTDMIGGGPFHLKPGEWTDDTSMALCLAESLIECRGFNPRDQMERYCRWKNEGHLSSNGRCFDFGNTVNEALQRFKETGEVFSGSTNFFSAGNGSIMRLAPVPMFFYPDEAEVIRYSGESSRTTHGAGECIDACRLFGWMISKALSGADRDIILTGYPHKKDLCRSIRGIANGNYRYIDESEIKGNGYVVKSLEAALWAFHRTDNFKNVILTAVNLGDDADTTGAICGQLAGAFYGESAIPAHWLTRLAKREMIEDFVERLKEQKDGKG